MYSNEVGRKKYIRYAKQGAVAIFSLLCISGLFCVGFEIGFWIAFFLTLKLIYLCNLPSHKVSDIEFCIMLIGVPLYALRLLLLVYPNVQDPLSLGLSVFLIVIALILSCVDFKGMIGKTEMQIPGIKNILEQFAVCFVILLIFCWGIGSYILPYEKTVEEAYVSDMHKERTHSTKGPDYRYYIEYVGFDSNQRAEAQVSNEIYHRVTPILGHIYVSKGKNIFGKTITTISLTKETNKIKGTDVLIGIGIVFCSMGASYVYHTIYMEMVQEEELKRAKY